MARRRAMHYILYIPETKRITHRHVIINSYMRSGSSFFGELLGFRPDTFYWFELFGDSQHGVSYRKNQLSVIQGPVRVVCKNIFK